MNLVTEYLGAFLTYRKPRRWNTEKRNFAVLSFRIRGDTLFTFKEGPLKVESGQVLYLPPHIEYQQEGQAAEELIYLHFNTEQPFFSKPTVFTLPLYGSFYGAVEAFNNGDPNRSLAHLYTILAALEHPPHPKGITAAEQYLAAHYTESATTVGRLAEVAGISETHFRNLFKVRNGTTPLKHLQKLRMERATLLLSSGYYTVTETARLCGYENEKNFTTAFKKTFGHSPVQFKNACTQGDKIAK